MEILARRVPPDELLLLNKITNSLNYIKTTEGYPIIYLQLSLDKTYIGVLVFNNYNTNNNDKGLYIRELGIVPEFRLKGIGSEIVKQFIINSISDNISEIRLEARNSEEFWKKLGFISTSEKALEEGAIVMVYPLRKTLINK